MGLANLVASTLVTFMTFIVQIGGVALSLQLVTPVHYLLIVPLVALLLWLVPWRARFSHWRTPSDCPAPPWSRLPWRCGS